MRKIGKVNKASLGGIASGVIAAIGAALGWDVELIGSVTLAVTGIIVWAVPNTA